MGRNFTGVAAGWGLALAAWAGLAQAQPTKEEQQEVWKDVSQAAKSGPADVPLIDEAVFHVPAGEAFIPQPQASRLLVMMGNPGNHADILGIVLPKDDHQDWFMPVRYVKAGFVKDDDAQHWDADKLLQDLRDGTAAGNEERAKQNLPQLEIVGWAEPPSYDAAHQRLVWALSARTVGAPQDAPRSVNYNTYALGRDGYFSLNMVAGLDELAQLKPIAAQQLADLEYNAGKRYADFNEKTDHVAEYGLAALVVGVAAHKLGFIALAAAFFAKFAKVIIIALAAFGGGFLRLFGRKSAARKASADARAPTDAWVGGGHTGAPPPPAPLPPLAPAAVAVPAAPAGGPAAPGPQIPEEPLHGPDADPYAETLPMPLHPAGGHEPPLDPAR